MKKGFTLIELLAVIVILAIIALIATPIVLDIIEDSKNSSIKRSVELYLDGVEQAIAKSELNDIKIDDGVYYVTEDGNLCIDELTTCPESKTILVDVNGLKPKSGMISIKNAEIKLYRNLKFNDNTYITKGTSDFLVTETYEPICVGASVATTGNIPTGGFNFGDEYICDLGDDIQNTFFVLENGDTTNLIDGRVAKEGEISLIMNSNLSVDGKPILDNSIKNKSLVAWCNDEIRCKINGNWTNKNGPITALEALYNQTSNWIKLNKNQISLPTKNQLESVFSNSMPAWLNDYMISMKHDISYIAGYWVYDYNPLGNNAAYSVDYVNKIGNGNSILTTHHFGIRPIITISKSELK